MTDIDSRADLAVNICHEAGRMAVGFFANIGALHVEHKGAQDFVSEADREVELLVRRRLAEAFPEDGIVGEEHAPVQGTSGYTWVIDPIDGTTNFIHGIPAWTVVLACVQGGKTRIGVIHDPVHGETYLASAGQGATLNGDRLDLSDSKPMTEGTVGVGYSNRVSTAGILRAVPELVAQGAMFHRNASGALSLAYVSAGRLLGYVEEHMNAWDCLAGQLLVAEAGGDVEDQNADDMIENGGRVVVGAPTVFETLVEISDRAFGAGT